MECDNYWMKVSCVWWIASSVVFGCDEGYGDSSGCGCVGRGDYEMKK